MLDLFALIQEKYGLLILVLLLIILFGCLVFWKLIWKVWSEAMKAKDDEITRLAKERDEYQMLVFERLRTSDPERARPRPPIEHQSRRDS